MSLPIAPRKASEVGILVSVGHLQGEVPTVCSGRSYLGDVHS